MKHDTEASLATWLRQLIRTGQCQPPTEDMRRAVDTAIAEVSR